MQKGPVGTGFRSPERLPPERGSKEFSRPGRCRQGTGPSSGSAIIFASKPWIFQGQPPLWPVP